MNKNTPPDQSTPVPVVVAMEEGCVAQIFSDRPLKVVLLDRLRPGDEHAVEIPLPDGEREYCQILSGTEAVSVSPEFTAAYFEAAARWTR